MKCLIAASIVVLSTSTMSFAAQIHEDVRKLDFKAVNAYFSQGGDPNLMDERTEKTLLAVAVEQAFPKSFELKNYPFDKQTFLFIKKMVHCGLTTGVKQITQHLVYDNPQGDSVFPSLEGNQGDVPNQNCNAQGECEPAKKDAKAPQEPSCLSQEEIGAFISQVRKDAPNSVTSVTDVLAAANDFVFEHLLFYEEVQPAKPEFNMIRLLISNKAQLLPDMSALIKKSSSVAETYARDMETQSSVRLLGDGIAAFSTIVIKLVASSYQVSRAGVRYPLNAAFYMISVKSIIDLRNYISASVYRTSLKNEYASLNAVVTDEPVKK